MNNLIINSIKQILEKNNASSESHKYINFYEELKKLKEAQDIYSELKNWFKKIFEIRLLKITLFLEDNQSKIVVFQDLLADCANSDKNLNKYYNIDMNSGLFIEFCFVCANNKQFDEITKKEEHIQMFLCMVSLLVSNISYQEMVKSLTFKDPLTKTYNRKFFIEHITKILPLARKEDKEISFLMIGIDHFKAVIDEFNYDIGDKVIINLSKVLQSNIRKSDLLIRIEGDKFLIAIVVTNDKFNATLMAKKLIEKFAQSEVVVNEQGHILKKTISIGITHYYKESTIDQILKNADISLHEAKILGRGQVKEYMPNSEICVELF